MILSKLLSKTVIVEDTMMSDVLVAKDLVNAKDSVSYRKFLERLRSKYGVDYSTEVHKQVQKKLVTENNPFQADVVDKITLSIIEGGCGGRCGASENEEIATKKSAKDRLRLIQLKSDLKHIKGMSASQEQADAVDDIESEIKKLEAKDK